MVCQRSKILLVFLAIDVCYNDVYDFPSPSLASLCDLCRRFSSLIFDERLRSRRKENLYQLDVSFPRCQMQRSLIIYVRAQFEQER